MGRDDEALLLDAIRAAVLEERESCARALETLALTKSQCDGYDAACCEGAAGIRARA